MSTLGGNVSVQRPAQGHLNTLNAAIAVPVKWAAQRWTPVYEDAHTIKAFFQFFSLGVTTATNWISSSTTSFSLVSAFYSYLAAPSSGSIDQYIHCLSFLYPNHFNLAPRFISKASNPGCSSYVFVKGRRCKALNTAYYCCPYIFFFQLFFSFCTKLWRFSWPSALRKPQQITHQSDRLDWDWCAMTFGSDSSNTVHKNEWRSANSIEIKIYTLAIFHHWDIIRSWPWIITYYNRVLWWFIGFGFYDFSELSQSLPPLCWCHHLL